ncbi:MAG: FGGY-family carbohydrate kinase [Acidimicrobiales bacterium]|nr:FGGY-family carbohydrate kinase [Acidimicrobiales bacterium]
MSGPGTRRGPVTVGIDIGTTAVKAVAADDEGRVLARARVPHELRSPTSGAFEHDIDRAWRADVVEALTRVARDLDVAAVEVSAMVPSLGAVDAAGHGISPGLLYGDHRGESDRNDPSQPGDNGEVLAFLAWLAREAPHAAGYWPAQAVANHALTGTGAIDSTTAMTAVPLFDFVGWSAEEAAAVGTAPDRLPHVVPGVEPVGRVLDGLPAAGALVGGGTIDALGEQLVAGADDTGDVLVICGATLITWGVLDEWRTVPGLWTVPHTAPGKVLIGGPSNAGGLFQDRVARWLAPEALDAADGVEPDDLPVWLPYVRGERTPLHRRDLRAAAHGLALHHEAAHLRRAAHEAAGFVVRHHLDLAAAAGLAPRRIVATGGGVRSTSWMQALADTTGLPVDVVAVPEGAALGAAFLARCVAGLESGTADACRWARTDHRVEPDPSWVGPVAARYTRFRMLSDEAVAAGEGGGQPGGLSRTNR